MCVRSFECVRIGAVAMCMLVGATLPARTLAQNANREALRSEGAGWLEDRDRAEGIGIRVGDLELHPGFGAEVGYDSNVFYDDDGPQGSALLRFTPHLLVSTLTGERRDDEGGGPPSDEALEDGEGGEREGNPPSVAFRGGISAGVYHYFETAAKTNVGGDVDLRLVINPERPFQLTLFESFGRTIRPFVEAPAETSYARVRNDVGVDASFGTRGNILRGHLGYRFSADIFEDDIFSFATNLTHTIDAGGSWRFLPHTAQIYALDVAITSYTGDPGAAVTLLSPSVRMRMRWGINGAVTNTFSVLGIVGYAAGFYEDGDDYDSLIGQVEARWQISPGTRLAVGYDRDFFNSYLGGFNRRDRGYLNLQLLVGGSFLLGVEGSAGLYEFGPVVSSMGGAPIGTTIDRTDIRLTASLFAEYRFADWLALNGTFRYAADITDYQFNFVRGTGPVIDPAEYQKMQAWAGVRAFY